MHILATFATLCCQTRWPRNHSCTTQEHVSLFFGTFSDIFGNFDFFDKFAKNAQKVKICEKRSKHNFTNAHTFAKRFHKRATSPKTFRACSQVSANVQMCKCANVQMCKNVSCTKCANLQRKYFSKCRNHKSALCTKTQMQISAHVTISEMQNSFLSVWKFFVVLWKVFYMCTIFYKNNILFLLINNNLYIITYYKKINKSQLKIHKNNLAICFKKII